MNDPDTCFKCGANAWTSCQHREATRAKPAFVDAPDKRDVFTKASGGGKYGSKTANGGLNFKTRKRK